MSGVNKVILLGNLGRDPETKALTSGVKVANFSIATSEKYESNGEWKEKTEWHNLVAFRGLAGIVEKYLRKGSKVYIEGSLQTRSWEDKDGNKKYMTEIVVRELVMLGDKDGGRGREEEGERDRGARDEGRGKDAPRQSRRDDRDEFSRGTVENDRDRGAPGGRGGF